MEGGRSEVKGAWFVTLRGYVLERHGEEVLRALAEALGPEPRRILEGPLASDWYPEEVLQEMLAVAHRLVTDGDDERFVRFIEGCTEQGVTRFFSVLIQLSSPGFILSKVPFMWERVRRGPGRVEVARVDDGSRVYYRRFPFFDDVRYRLLTVGSLRAVVRRCTGTEPEVAIHHWAPDECVVDVKHD